MSKKIHVMQVTFGMGIGGMERVIMDLCRYMAPDRYCFTICCVSVRGLLADQMEAEGVRVIFCPNQTRLAKYLRGIELSRIFQESDVQVIHTHHTTAFVHGTIGAHLAGSPILINTDHCKNYPIEKRWMMLEKVASFTADEIVAVSHHTRDELIRYEGIAPDKISVIHNGINIKLTRNESLGVLRNEFGIDADELVIGTVGRIEHQKGLDLLLEAAPYVIKRFPKTKFLIVGGGSKLDELRRQCLQLRISDHVIITGWRTDAVDLIRLFDCFVSTSNFEGMPMVLLEAMSLAKPIIAMAVGGVPEVVEDGITGQLVRCRDPEVLSHVLLGLIADRPLAARMGQSGRIRYEKHFTAQVMADAYEKLYRKYLGERGIGSR